MFHRITEDLGLEETIVSMNFSSYPVTRELPHLMHPIRLKQLNSFNILHWFQNFRWLFKHQICKQHMGLYWPLLAERQSYLQFQPVCHIKLSGTFSVAPKSGLSSFASPSAQDSWWIHGCFLLMAKESAVSSFFCTTGGNLDLPCAWKIAGLMLPVI